MTKKGQCKDEKDNSGPDFVCSQKSKSYPDGKDTTKRKHNQITLVPNLLSVNQR